MLENRKILASVIGYIIGIILGLYCKISIALLYLIIFLIYLITSEGKEHRESSKHDLHEAKTFKLISFKRYFRYIKIIFSKKVIKIIIISFSISNVIVLFQNYKYENLYKDFDGKDINISGIVVQRSSEKCRIKVKKGKFKNTYLFVYLNKVGCNVEYADEITIQGRFSEPTTNTNYKGFDYSKYLKTLKVYGSIKAKKVEVISKNNSIFVLRFANKLNLKIRSRIEKSELSYDEKALIKAILIGDKEMLYNILYKLNI